MIDKDNYILVLNGLNLTGILESWMWLTGADKSIVALTKSGDMLLKDSFGKLYFLDTGGGNLEMVANNFADFLENNLSDGQMDELLLPNLIDKLTVDGILLEPGQVYSYLILPILGGPYDSSNMYPLEAYEHYSLTGEMHHKIKDFPDGKHVRINVQ